MSGESSLFFQSSEVNPHLSQDDEVIAQGFGFTGDLSLRVE